MGALARTMRWHGWVLDDAPGLRHEVLTAWASGEYGSLTEEQVRSLQSTSSLEDFACDPLASILRTLAGVRGRAVFEAQQD